MGIPTGKTKKVRSIIHRVFQISGIWCLVSLLFTSCGGLQIDTQILSPSFATATAFEQTQQGEPTRTPPPVVESPSATATPEITPMIPTITASPTLEESDFVSWDRLIDYDLLKDIDWSVYDADVYIPVSGFRHYAFAVTTTWGIGIENSGNELYLRNYDPVTDYSARLDRVTFVFRCILDDVITTFEGKEQKVRIAGEPGILWSHIVEPDKHHEYMLFFEHDGANYSIFGSIELPSVDHTAMEKYQTALFYMMSTLIID